VTRGIDLRSAAANKVLHLGKICHPDRSVAKWRDPQFLNQHLIRPEATTPPFVIPSEAEGSVVSSTSI
jgi:hypothetical protein